MRSEAERYHQEADGYIDDRLVQKIDDLTKQQLKIEKSQAKKQTNPSPEFVSFCLQLETTLTMEAITLLWILLGKKALKHD